MEITLRCRHYFNVFLLSIINNIIPFFKQTEGEAAQKFSSSEIFDFDSYYAQFPDQESHSFVSDFSKTMVFLLIYVNKPSQSNRCLRILLKKVI